METNGDSYGPYKDGKEKKGKSEREFFTTPTETSRLWPTHVENQERKKVEIRATWNDS